MKNVITHFILTGRIVLFFLFSFSTVIAQESQDQVTGKVTDQSGEILIGVNVLVEGTNNGTSTDFEGEFTLENVNLNSDALVVSYIGYETITLPIGGETNLTITLESDSEVLDEVVVVGYGTQKKVNLTGSVDNIGSKRIESRPIGSLGEALQGAIPNLNISVRSGEPDASPDYNIRGFESINGGSPLVLVDGIPFDNPNQINPNNIESVTILKDASTAAVYGARAAFGVILIETKKAKDEGFNVSFNTQFSADQPIMHMDPVEDSYTYATWMNIARQRTEGRNHVADFWVENIKKYNENPTPENEWSVVDGVLYFNGSTNFQQEVMRDFAPMQDYNLTVSGGSQNAKYYATVGMNDQNGILKHGPQNFRRYNMMVKSDFKINDWLDLENKLSYYAQISDKPHPYSGVGLNEIARMGNTYAWKFPSTELFESPDPSRDYSQYEGMFIHRNNWAPYNIEGGRDTYNNGQLVMTQRAIIKPLKNWQLRGDFTYNLFNQRSENVQSEIQKLLGGVYGQVDLLADEIVGPGFSTPTYIENGFSRNHYFVLNFVTDYEIDPDNSPHYLKAMVGFNQEWIRNNSITATAYDMVSPNISAINATTGIQTVRDGKSHAALRGVFYRLNYIFDNRYLLEFNGRYDGTSRFPKDDRFGFFPSFSVGWRLSEESFMSEIDFISDLKIRASYGELGNQDVSYYPYLATMSQGFSTYLMEGERISYVRSPNLVSPTLTWEKVNTRNIGVDIGLIDHKLTATIDAFVRETKDMLMNVEYPSILGASAPDENAADLETRGWEFKTTYRDAIGSDWDYSISLYLSDSKTKITKYENPTQALNEYYVGQEIGEIWGFETVGIFQNEKAVEMGADQSVLGGNWMPGDIQYKDLNGDGVIDRGSQTLDDPGDRRIIGNTTPRYSFGMNLDASYKGLTLGIFFQGVGQRDYSPPNRGNFWFFPYNYQYMDKYFITESWTEDNRDAYFHAAGYNNYKNQEPQTRYLQNAAYVRLKNLSLSYEIPQKILDAIRLQRIQVYMATNNLWEYSPIHKPFDPEYIFQSGVAYPLQRTYSIGLNLSF